MNVLIISTNKTPGIQAKTHVGSEELQSTAVSRWAVEESTTISWNLSKLQFQSSYDQEAVLWNSSALIGIPTPPPPR